MSGIMYNVTIFKSKINNLINEHFYSFIVWSCKNGVKLTCQSYKEQLSYKDNNKGLFYASLKKKLYFLNFLNFSYFLSENEIKIINSISKA